MKTLYININGIEIQNSKDVNAVGKSKDAIVNKFYYELGKEILKGVDASIGRGINKKGIVTDFMGRDKESYDAIWKEWKVVKDKLLGENPTGSYKVSLPAEYIIWLNNNSQTTYSEIAKSLHSKDGVVEISIDKIYRNAVGILVNSIESSNCKQFVVNDRCVTDDSKISLDIMEKVKGIVFVPYDDYGKCPKCRKNPCECIQELPVCPKCGSTPCECKKTKKSSHKAYKNQSSEEKVIDLCDLFPVHNIILGKTNIQEIAVSGKIGKTDIGYRYEMNQYASTTYVIQRYEDKFISLIHIDSYRPKMFPDHWKQILGFTFKTPQKKCLKALKERRFFLIETSDECVWNAITPDKKFVFTFRFDYDGLSELEVLPYQCPYCGYKNVEILNSDDEELALCCSHCKNEWGIVDSDRSCAEDLDGYRKSKEECEFDEDDYDYDDDLHTYDDKPGKTVQIVYEELLGLTGDDYHLGDTLIDLSIDEELLNAMLHRCKQKLSITIRNELDVYKNDISDLIRLVQKYYYMKNKR